MTPCKIEGCEKKRYKMGWCSMHYSRWWRSGDVGEAAERQRGGRTAGSYKPVPLETRYEVREDGCWIWLGQLSHNGYGTTTHRGKNTRAHRLVYEQLVGPIPAGLEIDHLCRVRNCVNPDHLEPVTRQENLRRMHQRRKEAAPVSASPTGA